MSSTFRAQTTFTLEQAVDAAPSLASLQERIRDSQRYLDEVRNLLPTALRSQVQAGPVTDHEWCMLVGNSAVSTKLRQLVPLLLATLNEKGAQITAIRIKVQTPVR